MTDKELIDLVEDAIESLVRVRRVLGSRADGECLHENAVDVATFTNPSGFMCPDCGAHS